MRLVWDIEYDYDEAYVIGVREGLARWWRSRRKLRKRAGYEWPTSDGPVVDISPLITMLDPDTSAFQTMLMCLPNKSAVVHHWLEDELMPRITSTLLWGEWDWIEA